MAAAPIATNDLESALTRKATSSIPDSPKMCNMDRPSPTLVLTGLSGAGKSSALHYLENLGYFCVDSILPHLSLELLEQLQSYYPQVALGLELSRKEFLADFDRISAPLQQRQIPLVFLDAADPVLVQRFSANRRRHPFSDRADGLLAAIQQERQLLQAVERQSTHTIDTTQLSLRQLYARLEPIALGNEQPPLTVSLASFGFKYGVPLDANLVFDIRFLPNPYYIPELRSLTGRDLPIQEFLFGNETAQSTYRQILNTLSQFLPHYLAERRTQVLVAIGCTGGQHRSVAFVERLALGLRDELLPSTAYQLQVTHRNLSHSQAEIAALARPGRGSNRD
ncbi:RNase adapter RapZ [Synechococcus sp. PCC 7336]|uniref:RNase adapter RapZ n=1 Tax=Synechococcus sp. PCC 7336 TaxID=195250 RepID=UPI001D0D49CE|nr:RNase adapter RapZ [Synechococcus sp. PCC 7336]